VRRGSSSERGVERDVDTRCGGKIIGHEDCCFRRVRSPNEVVVVKNKHSFLSLAIFQPEETNCKHRAGDSRVIRREADLTPSTSTVCVRGNRIVAGGDLLWSIFLLQSSSIPVLNHTATTLTRSSLPTFIISNVQSSPLACQLPFLGRKESTRGSE